MEHKTVKTEILVIGSGASGLRAAIAAAEKGAEVAIVSKGGCASPEILGFNAPVLPGDSKELYFEDLERSGYGINDSRLAAILSEKVLDEVAWLESNGVEFDKDDKGAYKAIHTLGTTYARLIRAGVSTGSTEMKMLTEKCGEHGIEIYMPIDILGLLKAGDRVIGAYGIDMKDGAIATYLAKAVVLASGGCGAMQSFSTYPKPLIGDGYAMAYEAGATLVDMEFQQFEPCCFVYPEEIRGKVIATTLLRHGAELLNGEGREFMSDYGLTRDNAQKGSLSRAMNSEVLAGRGTPHGGIYYNMTMLDEKLLYVDHEIFTKPAVQMNIDLKKEMPEMMPAAHTNLGGIVIDGKCFTGVEGLYACGEVIGGLHGGNRLGGCAGAETVVFGRIAGEGAAEYASGAEFAAAGECDQVCRDAYACLESFKARSGNADLTSIRPRLGECLKTNLSINRSGVTIAEAAAEVEQLEAELASARTESTEDLAEAVHCAHMLLLASMQIKASEMRKESRGVFYRLDYPEIDEANWRKNILIRRNGDGMQLSLRDAVKQTSF